MAELRLQADHDTLVMTVVVGGHVRAPGSYPLERGMRISDLLRAGGGLDEAAYAIEAELTRYEVVNGEYRETALLPVDLAAVLRGSDEADLILSPYDYLTIQEIPQWREQQTVELIGEFDFPGVYPLVQGETLSSVLARAGGVTELAFVEGSLFLREDLKEREREQLETLATRLESDLATIEWWPKRSSKALVSFSSPKTLTHSLKERWVMSRVERRS